MIFIKVCEISFDTYLLNEIKQSHSVILNYHRSKLRKTLIVLYDFDKLSTKMFSVLEIGRKKNIAHCCPMNKIIFVPVVFGLIFH